MAMTQRLDFRQSQSLVMTPQLQQAIKLLQMSNLELTAFVDHELERNPLLEPDESAEREAGEKTPRGEASDGPADRGDNPDSNDSTSETGLRDTVELASSDRLPTDNDAPLDTDYDAAFDGSLVDAWQRGDQTSAKLGAGTRGGFDEQESSIEQRLSDPVTLRQYLLSQLHLDFANPVERLIGVHLIDMLDESGYLSGDPADIASLLGCEVARVEATLKHLQGFDPVGIFARDLSQCLSLQLADRNRLDPAMARLLENLELLAKRDFAKLKQLCGVDDEDLVEMIGELKALDPKPALSYETPVTETVVPDVLMRPGPKGSWLVELNSETLPRVLVNKQYYASVSKQTRNKADKEFMTECLQSANWLVKSLHQRATTILKVATEIIAQQDDFFRKGVCSLRPLTLRDVADVIEMHESTVSRVTSNKYLATPRGIYELKYFFTSTISGTGGGSHSSEAVRHRIKSLIDTEKPGQVLSDDTIVGLLRDEEIDIARRTVAKYREAMRIPSSVERRRQKTAILLPAEA